MHRSEGMQTGSGINENHGDHRFLPAPAAASSELGLLYTVLRPHEPHVDARVVSAAGTRTLPALSHDWLCRLAPFTNASLRVYPQVIHSHSITSFRVLSTAQYPGPKVQGRPLYSDLRRSMITCPGSGVECIQQVFCLHCSFASQLSSHNQVCKIRTIHPRRGHYPLPKVDISPPLCFLRSEDLSRLFPRGCCFPVLNPTGLAARRVIRVAFVYMAFPASSPCCSLQRFLQA